MSAALCVERLQVELARRGWGLADLTRRSDLVVPAITAALSGRPVEPRSLGRTAVARVETPRLADVDAILPGG
ncbi:MAG: hypothetical protein ACRENX_10535 [Candidatus Dormibacteria bacterium]